MVYRERFIDGFNWWRNSSAKGDCRRSRETLVTRQFRNELTTGIEEGDWLMMRGSETLVGFIDMTFECLIILG